MNPAIPVWDGWERFESSILPRYLRRTKSVEELLPWLYLKGVSTGDFNEALKALLGPLFRKMVGFAEQHCAAWYILSAKHGLVAPEMRLEPYELTLRDMSRAAPPLCEQAMLRGSSATTPGATAASPAQTPASPRFRVRPKCSVSEHPSPATEERLKAGHFE